MQVLLYKTLFLLVIFSGVSRMATQTLRTGNSLSTHLDCLPVSYCLLVLKQGEKMSTGKFISIDAPMDYINLHVRGGYIIPQQV